MMFHVRCPFSPALRSVLLLGHVWVGLLLAPAICAADLYSANDGFAPDLNAWASRVLILQQGDIVVSGLFTEVDGHERRRTARFHPDGHLDLTFNPQAEHLALSLIEQPDGKILFAGFSDGIPASASIWRLHADGSLDAGFDPVVTGKSIQAMARQPDGKIVIAGSFSSVNGVGRENIARLNPDGSLDSDFNPGANEPIYVLDIQPDGKILVGGAFTELGGLPRDRIGRLHPDGRLDLGFGAGVDGDVRALARLRDGRIMVGGAFTMLGGTPRKSLGRLLADGSVDADFSLDVEDDDGEAGVIHDLVVRQNGAIIFAGSFTAVDGVPCWNIGHIFANGALDPAFRAEPDDVVLGLALQSDGKIVATGRFDSWNGMAQAYLARIYPCGSLDADFNPDASDWVYSLSRFPGGRILIGGEFTELDGQTRTRIARVHPDGSLDTTFQAQVDDGAVEAIIPEPQWVGPHNGNMFIGGTFNSLWGDQQPLIAALTHSGGIITNFNAEAEGEAVRFLMDKFELGLWVAGSFNAMGGEHATHFARLHPSTGKHIRSPQQSIQGLGLATMAGGVVLGGDFSDVLGKARQNIAHLHRLTGSLDVDFNPGANDRVYVLALQPDGKILAGGRFTELGGQPCNRLGRLHPDGSFDTSFSADINGPVWALALLADGKMVVGGGFSLVNGVSRNNIARLHPDGSLDESFDPGANDAVYALALQPDGKLLVGGQFTELGGQPRNRIGRLTTRAPAQQEWRVDGVGRTVTIRIGGSAPMIAGLTLDLIDANGNHVKHLGAAIYCNNTQSLVWDEDLGGISSLPLGTLFIRATGIYRTGQYLGSESLWQEVYHTHLHMSPGEGEAVGDRHPTFAWSPTEGATWYRLWINRNGEKHHSQWIEGLSWVPEKGLPGGDYEWWVQSWSPTDGTGQWSRKAAFTVPVQAPDILIQEQPQGPQDGHTLTYRWQKDSHATWYQLWVGLEDGDAWHDQWYPMTGGGAANITVPDHPEGNYTWWVRPWGPDGSGPWAGPMAFSTPSADPAKPVLEHPWGEQHNNYPQFLWFEADQADWYRLYVNRGDENVIDVWTTHNQWGVQDLLNEGEHTWWVGAWNRMTRRTVWSDPMVFTTPYPMPAAPHPTRPEDGSVVGPWQIDIVILFEWLPAVNTTWYRVYVQSPDETAFLNFWTQETEKLVHLDDIPSGEYTWWVGAWNPFHQDLVWSAPMTFSTPN